MAPERYLFPTSVGVGDHQPACSAVRRTAVQFSLDVVNNDDAVEISFHDFPSLDLMLGRPCSHHLSNLHSDVSAEFVIHTSP